MDFRNCYEDDAYAASYAKLEFPGTYYLAFRDLPALVAQHATGRRALDFGCGTGRSTRFLTQLGFETTGVDSAPEMIAHARTFDADGDYRLTADGDLGKLADTRFDLILAAFTFDNIPSPEPKLALLRALRRRLHPQGRLINLVSAPEIYLHEWASFSTKDFPENRNAGPGDLVRIVVTALDDHRPAVDVLWPDADYRASYREAGLAVLDVHRPLGQPEEPYAWVNETTISPWVIYVLGPTADL